MATSKMTNVTAKGSVGLLLRGHVPWEEAVDALREHYEHQRDEAAAALAALGAGEVTVAHQEGIYRVRSRVPVKPPATASQAPEGTS